MKAKGQIKLGGADYIAPSCDILTVNTESGLATSFERAVEDDGVVEFY